MIEIQVIERIEELLPYQDRWNDLVTRSDLNTIFQTFEWHRAWWEAFGEGANLLALLAWKEETLIGVAPLLRTRQRKPILGRKQWVVELIGRDASDYRDFIIDHSFPETRFTFFHWLQEHSTLWDILKLMDIPSTSDTTESLPTYFSRYDYPSEITNLHDAPTRLFNNPEEDQKIPQKKSLRRHHNHFKQRGNLELLTCKTTEEITPYLDSFFQQHIERWEHTNIRSQFLNEREREFYRAVVRYLGERGWLAFSIVRFNDEPIAFHFGFNYGERFLWYKPTFAVAHAKNSPGEVLIKYLFEYALANQFREFDFTIGEEAFKYRFANHIRHNYALWVFQNKWTHRFHCFWRDSKNLVKTRMSQYPKLKQRIRHTFTFFSQVWYVLCSFLYTKIISHEVFLVPFEIII